MLDQYGLVTLNDYWVDLEPFIGRISPPVLGMVVILHCWCCWGLLRLPVLTAHKQEIGALSGHAPKWTSATIKDNVKPGLASGDAREVHQSSTTWRAQPRRPVSSGNFSG